MTRQLVERLPVMIAPPWVLTRTQPIAVADAIGYLVGVLDRLRALVPFAPVDYDHAVLAALGERAKSRRSTHRS
jgi:hypothetical protein